MRHTRQVGGGRRSGASPARRCAYSPGRSVGRAAGVSGRAQGCAGLYLSGVNPDQPADRAPARGLRPGWAWSQLCMLLRVFCPGVRGLTTVSLNSDSIRVQGNRHVPRRLYQPSVVCPVCCAWSDAGRLDSARLQQAKVGQQGEDWMTPRILSASRVARMLPLCGAWQHGAQQMRGAPGFATSIVVTCPPRARPRYVLRLAPRVGRWSFTSRWRMYSCGPARPAGS